MGKTETISSKVRNETRVSILSTLIQHRLGIPSQSSKKEEETKGIQIGKEVVKLYIFVDDMILYLKDPKNSTKRLLHTINSFNKYKINLQISVGLSIYQQ
jgi:hypothetical protein